MQNDTKTVEDDSHRLFFGRSRRKLWPQCADGRPGRLRVFSDAEIQFCLMVKVLFGLPLLQITGMVSGILEMAGLE